MSENINREYKDRLFKFLFGREENRDWLLSLYNAVNGSDYQDPSALTFTTIENAVYMSMRNDVSFLIDETLSFYEQQSTFNPNMPLRMLIYSVMVFNKLIEDPDSTINLLSHTQQRLPTPKLICFYNGVEREPEEKILRLSDAFPEGSAPDIEARVRMININYGHNLELLHSCRPLHDYSFLIDRIRVLNDRLDDLEQAVAIAISELPDDSPIKPFIMANKAEVTYMCITEYNEKKSMKLFKEEYLAEGRAEGRAEGVISALSGLVKKGMISLSDAAAEAGLSTIEFQKKAGLI